MERHIGVDRLIDSIVPDISVALYRHFERLPGTPIEKLFELSLYAMGGLLFMNHGRARVSAADFSPHSFPRASDPAPPSERMLADVYFWRQYEVLDWKVDFLLGMERDAGRPRFIVVECDGHEFHERTKEQAAKDRSRDRRLQDAGYRIHRYTGSEIYRDPLKCVSDTLISLMNFADEA